MRLPTTAQLPEQPDSIAGVLDHGFELYARSWLRVAPFVLIAGPPMVLINNLLDKILKVLSQMITGVSPNAASLVVLIGLAIVVALAAIGCYNAATYRLGFIGRDKDPGFWNSLKQGFADAPRSLLVSIVFFILLVIAIALGAGWVVLLINFATPLETSIPEALRVFFSVVLVITAIVPLLMLMTFVMIPWSMGNCALVLRRTSIGESIATGFRLMTHNFWRSLISLTVPGVIYMIANGALAAVVLATFVRLMTTTVNSVAIVQLITAIAQIPVLAVVIPLVQAATVAIFSDLLFRREGADLRRRVEQL
jgi:hypothetical protein